MTTVLDQTGWLHWLNTNAGVIQTVSTVVLTGVTAYYAITTHLLVSQARRSAKSASRSAAAAKRSADAAEKTIAFTVQERNERLGLGPQIVREGIARAKGLIVKWKTESRAQSFDMPEPEALLKSSLRDAVPHARLLSTKCADLLVLADVAITNAHPELQRLREAARNNLHVRRTEAASKAEMQLDTAMGLLHAAEKLIPAPDQTPGTAASDTAL